MSNLDDLIEQYKGIRMFSLPGPAFQAQIRYAQECETIITQIAKLAPNTLGSQRFIEVCCEVGSNYPDHPIDTLRALRWHLSIDLDTALRRNFAEKVRKAEEEESRATKKNDPSL